MSTSGLQTSHQASGEAPSDTATNGQPVTTDQPAAPSTVEANTAPARERPPVDEKKLRLLGPRAFRLLWDGHSVTGVVIGLGLFVIFYCGAFALFRADMMAWADPALRDAPETAQATTDRVVEPIFDERPPAEGRDVLVVYPFNERPYYWLHYPAAAGDTVDTWVSAATGRAMPPRGRSQLSEIPYKLHYFAQAGLGGHLVSGVIAVFFLFAVTTGLLIHLRKLPKDWHTFRPRAALRTTLADAHNVLGLAGLPYAVMYAITGAFFSLLVVILGPTVLVVFDGDQAALEQTLSGVEVPAFEATDRDAAMRSPDELIAALPESWDEAAPLTVHYHGWGDAGALAVVESSIEEALTTSGKAVLNAETGAVLATRHPRDAPALGRTTTLMTSLHFATFGGRLVDVLFFLLALATSAVIVSGNVLWITVRRPKDPRATPWLHRALARLTVGVTAGLVAATPLLFLAAQVLPLEMAGRQGWENIVFFGGWLALIAAAFLGRSPQRAAQWQLVLAGGLSLGVPLAGGLFGGAWPWVSAANGWWGILWIDAGFLLGAPLLFWIAWRLGRAQASP